MSANPPKADIRDRWRGFSGIRTDRKELDPESWQAQCQRMETLTEFRDRAHNDLVWEIQW